MNDVYVDRDYELYGYTGSRTTWAKEMNSGRNHAPGAGSIAKLTCPAVYYACGQFEHTLSHTHAHTHRKREREKESMRSHNHTPNPVFIFYRITRY